MNKDEVPHVLLLGGWTTKLESPSPPRATAEITIAQMTDQEEAESESQREKRRTLSHTTGT
jgi:hypothetical protein